MKIATRKDFQNSTKQCNFEILAFAMIIIICWNLFSVFNIYYKISFLIKYVSGCESQCSRQREGVCSFREEGWYHFLINSNIVWPGSGWQILRCAPPSLWDDPLGGGGVSERKWLPNQPKAWSDGVGSTVTQS